MIYSKNIYMLKIKILKRVFQFKNNPLKSKYVVNFRKCCSYYSLVEIFQEI